MNVKWLLCFIFFSFCYANLKNASKEPRFLATRLRASNAKRGGAGNVPSPQKHKLEEQTESKESDFRQRGPHSKPQSKKFDNKNNSTAKSFVGNPPIG